MPTIDDPPIALRAHCGRVLSEEAVQGFRETWTKIEEYPLFKQAISAAEARIQEELKPLL
jgi:hypothetical protein